MGRAAAPARATCPRSTSNSRCRFLLVVSGWTPRTMPSSSINWLSQSPVSSSWNDGRAGSGMRPVPSRVTRGRFDDRREVAGRRAALDGHAVAHAHLEWQAAHLDEDAFLGVLHEQQRPGRVDVGDDPFDAHGSPERRRDRRRGSRRCGSAELEVPGARCRVLVPVRGARQVPGAGRWVPRARHSCRPAATSRGVAVRLAPGRPGRASTTATPAQSASFSVAHARRGGAAPTGVWSVNGHG